MPLRKTKRPLYERIGLGKREYYNDDILKPHERDFVRKFSRLGEEMRWIKRDCKIAPSGIGYLPTNDFIWRGREWELKSSLGGEIKERTIIRRINESVDRGKRNLFLDLDGKEATFKLLVRLERYNISRIKDAKKGRHIENIVIWDRRGVYSMVLK